MNFNFSNSQENSIGFKALRYEHNIMPEIECFNHCARRATRHDTRSVAGLTIFAFIILQSWRKSKTEIKQLEQSLENLKKNSSRTETQLYIYNSLVKVEQSRTDELASQLKRALDNLKRKTATWKTVSASLANLKSSQIVVEQEFKKKLEEYEAMNEILSQTKKQLFRTMMEQRNLHLQLCKEQRLVQSLENEKKILITEIRTLNTENRQVEENCIKQIRLKDRELLEAKMLIGRCQGALIDVQKTQKYFINMQSELQMSRLRITDLQKNALWSFCHRMGSFWSRIIKYPRNTIGCFHILAFYLMPATPAPTKFKFNR